MDHIIGNAKVPGVDARHIHPDIASSDAGRAAALAAVLPYLSYGLIEFQHALTLRPEPRRKASGIMWQL